MLSRVAEALYWMGRQVERAENTARLLEVNYYATLEGAGVVRDEWEPLLTISGTEQAFRGYHDSPDGSSVPQWLAFERRNPSSIVSSLGGARENARSLRDRLPSEMWECVNHAYHNLVVNNTDVLARDELHSFCVAVRETSHLFFGIAFATLPRDQGWAFLRAGQKLERADNVLRLLQVRYRQGAEATEAAEVLVENHRWMAVLKTASAYEAYRKRYHYRLEPRRIAEFLLLSTEFPRSVQHAAASVAQSLQDIAHVTDAPLSTRPEVRELLRDSRWLVSRLEHARVGQILDDEAPGLGELLADVNAIGSGIHRAYFTSRPG